MQRSIRTPYDLNRAFPIFHAAAIIAVEMSGKPQSPLNGHAAHRGASAVVEELFPAALGVIDYAKSSGCARDRADQLRRLNGRESANAADRSVADQQSGSGHPDDARQLRRSSQRFGPQRDR